MEQILVKDLCLGYEGQVVVKDLNFVINEKDYLCIIGENGSGKTTLVKTLLSLNEPLSGEIIFKNGIDKRSIGYLPQQNSARKDFPATVMEIVTSGFVAKAEKRFFYSQKQKQEALNNLEKMGVKDLCDRPFSKLSGGQQQRVLLARCLCAADKILLLDEPVSGLDKQASENMYELIRQLNKSGTTIIMITHDLNDVINDASHILHIGNDVRFLKKEDYLKKGDHSV